MSPPASAAPSSSVSRRATPWGSAPRHLRDPCLERPGRVVAPLVEHDHRDRLRQRSQSRGRPRRGARSSCRRRSRRRGRSAATRAGWHDDLALRSRPKKSSTSSSESSNDARPLKGCRSARHSPPPRAAALSAPTNSSSARRAPRSLAGAKLLLDRAGPGHDRPRPVADLSRPQTRCRKTRRLQSWRE